MRQCHQLQSQLLQGDTLLRYYAVYLSRTLAMDKKLKQPLGHAVAEKNNSGVTTLVCLLKIIKLWPCLLKSVKFKYKVHTKTILWCRHLQLSLYRPLVRLHAIYDFLYGFEHSSTEISKCSIK